MSAPDITAETMGQFRDSGVEKHSTILLGAGASITSGLPSWDDFAIRLLVSSGSVDEDSAELLLKRQDPIIAVEAARTGGQLEWGQQLREALYTGVKPLNSLSPSPLHLAAVGHYLERQDSSSLVTLNFDVLLESVLEIETDDEPHSVTNSAEHIGQHSVHHLHGIITPDITEDVVLTLNDFTTLIEQQDSWQVNFLKSAVSRGH
ncbi:SIR2 family protein [Corynebacterium casei]|uniref:SIR2 family protein n=1 Tax=Corynebacterium casei TaxID=160386 RepID=UPI001D008D62|nr:SIR2 family protein [Corynebacterium casei]